MLVVINTSIHGWCLYTLRSLRYWFLILFDMLFIINLIYYSRQHLDEIRLDKWPWNLIFCVGTRQVGIMSQWNFSLWIYSITLIYIYRINSSKNNIKTLLRLHEMHQIRVGPFFVYYHQSLEKWIKAWTRLENNKYSIRMNETMLHVFLCEELNFVRNCRVLLIIT